MSRAQRSLPAKSNALKIPVPVITHTCVPSVTGDGDDMFCLRTCLLPPPIGRLQSTLPLARSTHQRNTPGPSATLRKIRSAQTIGVEPDHAGSASVHATPSVLDQRTGRLVSELNPFRSGPRHCGQFSAVNGAVAYAAIVAARRKRFVTTPISLSPKLSGTRERSAPACSPTRFFFLP